MNGEMLLYAQRASGRQIAASLTASLLLLLGFLITLPFAATPLEQYNAFVPTIGMAVFIGDGVIAALLFSQAAVLGSRALVALATGFLFSSLLIVPYVLSFPGAFGPNGLISGGLNTTPWLYTFWHCGLPFGVIAYTILRDRSDEDASSLGAISNIIPLSIAATLLTVLGITIGLVIGRDWLPSMMANNINPVANNVHLMAACVSGLLAFAIAALWRGPRSLLDIWLMVTMWAWLLETILIVAVTGRYTVGWYSGRLIGMLSGVFVLLALMVEISRLYLQSALLAASEQQQRESRLFTLDAAASAIAHEVKQPITAMVTNAAAALIRARQQSPDIAKVTQSLELIVEDGHRAADVIGSVRALFGRNNTPAALVDINQLIRETIDLRRVELATHAITVVEELSSDLPHLSLQPLQMRQVFVNLLNNAVEALSERTAGRRRILIRTVATGDGGAAIDIVDSGNGVAPAQTDRIFDAFFTTKAYGTGIGLPLCRSIIEGHGGKLSVSSAAGEGTTFSIALPGPEL